MNRGLWLLLPLLLSTTACSELAGYPEGEVEQGAKLCADDKDNDLDGIVDCDDLDCDGSCPEATPVECADERDNDGDGLTDADDPRCWPVRPPKAQRCAEASGAEFIETFDVIPIIGNDNAPKDPWPWRSYHTGGEGDIATGSNSIQRDRSDALVVFVGNDNQDSNALPGPDTLARGLGALVRQVPFSGSWQGFELAFSVEVPEGGTVRAAIVPQELAGGATAPAPGAEAALVSVTIDAAESAPTLTLGVEGALYPVNVPAAPVCPEEHCLARVSVVLDESGFQARFMHPDGSQVAVRAPAPSSLSLPPARLVLWGGTLFDATSEDPTYALLDDLQLRVKPAQPCGYAAPQIPGPICRTEEDLGAYGHGVSVARSPGGGHCALVGAGPAADGAALPAVESWTTWSSSDEGETWERRSVLDSHSLELPEGAMPLASGIAADDDGFHAVLAYRADDDVQIAVVRGDDCEDWSVPEPGPKLPADAEGASYIAEKGDDFVYFSRPPDDGPRTLWRVKLKDDAKPVLVAELPSTVSAPVSVQRVGATDLVLSFPQVQASGAVGIGLLVQADDPADWQPADLSLPLPPPADLPEGQGRLTFDDFGVTSAAISFGVDGGFLLYGGKATTGRGKSAHWTGYLFEVGTARFTSAAGDFPESSTVPFVEAPEPADGNLIVAPAWGTRPSDTNPLSAPYFTSDPDTLHVLHASEVGTSWSVLPLDQAVTGDFELAFDLTLEPLSQDWETCAFYVGLGTNGGGIFASTRKARSCFDGYTVAPVVLLGEDVTSDGTDTSTCGGPDSLLVGAPQHLRLRREGDRVTVAFEAPDACGLVERVLDAPFSEALSEVQIGFGAALFGTDERYGCAATAGSASIRNLSLGEL